MEFNELKELIKLIDSTNIQKCEIQFDNMVIKADKRRQNETIVTKVQTLTESPVSHEVLQASATEPITIIPSEAKKVIVGNMVSSPIVGTFYASATPGGKPFAELGQKVKKGDILCIIEAMKVMNEIVSPFDGVIAEIFVSNEEMVDFGKNLFRIE